MFRVSSLLVIRVLQTVFLFGKNLVLVDSKTVSDVLKAMVRLGRGCEGRAAEDRWAENGAAEDVRVARLRTGGLKTELGPGTADGADRRPPPRVSKGSLQFEVHTTIHNPDHRFPGPL